MCVGFVVIVLERVLVCAWLELEVLVIPSMELVAAIEWLRGDKSCFFFMGSETCPKGRDFVCENVM